MFKYLLKLLASLRSHKNIKVDRLYYLDGIKPIKVNKYVLEECTVGRE
jgi:hypothetical protein